MIDIQFVKLDPAAVVPTQAYPGDAGWDLHILERAVLRPGQYRLLRSGISMALPEGFYARIVPRSSSMSKKELLVIEGTCDAGYRGEQLSGVLNVGDKTTILEPGDSVAQIVVQQVHPVSWTEVVELPEHVRGMNGFGSSGR